MESVEYRGLRSQVRFACTQTDGQNEDRKVMLWETLHQQIIGLEEFTLMNLQAVQKARTLEVL